MEGRRTGGTIRDEDATERNREREYIFVAGGLIQALRTRITTACGREARTYVVVFCLFGFESVQCELCFSAAKPSHNIAIPERW